MQKKSQFFGFCILMLTAIIWGTSFIAQAGAVKSIEAFTFNAVRSPLGALVLIPVIIWHDIKAGRKVAVFDDPTPDGKRNLLKAGIICGLCMTGGVVFQTIGLYTTTVAKSGFITALYVILVPLLGALLLKTFVRRIEWFAAVFSCIGMYFICINEAFSINIGDVYTILCAFCYAGQCLTIGIFANKVDGVRLSCLQLIITSIVSSIGMFIWEAPTWNAIANVFWELVYAGVMSSGIAYTLQIIGQAYVSAPTACITLSLESVFALLSGIVWLSQIPTLRETFGCVIVFIAVLMAQLPIIMKK